MKRSHQSDVALGRISPDQQVERFKQAAPELGAYEDETAFRDKLRVIAREKPRDAPKKRASTAPGPALAISANAPAL